MWNNIVGNPDRLIKGEPLRAGTDPRSEAHGPRQGRPTFEIARGSSVLIHLH
jgi:hypothetical protein